MVTEHDSEFRPWPSEPDPIRVAALPLIEVVMEMAAHGSHERAAALREILAAVERIKHALVPLPRLN
jgi:hypothetical protein